VFPLDDTFKAGKPNPVSPMACDEKQLTMNKNIDKERIFID
jgi:hypothetical protein